MILHLSLICIVLLINSTFAFDIGHHNDLIFSAMAAKGYEEIAIELAQINAWYVDYYGVLRTETNSSLARNLHFLGRNTDAKVKAYQNTLLTAIEPLIKELVVNNQTAEYVALLGISLHTVQNFYSHSNFVVKNGRKDCNCASPRTWYTQGAELKGVITPTLSKLGSYCDKDATNKESYARAGWESAYLAAFAASIEWIDIFEGFAAKHSPYYPTLGREAPIARDESLYANVISDLYYMYRVAEWTVEPKQYSSGHWKGPHSGATLQSDYVRRRYETDATELYWRRRFSAGGAPWEALAEALAKPMTSTVTRPPIANDTIVVDINKVKAVIIRTHAVKSVGGGRLTDARDAYAELRVDAGTDDAQLFREAVQRDVDDLKPAWTSIYFVPGELAASKVSVEYTLKDENGFVQRTDSDVRIKGESATIKFSVALADGKLSGDVSGAAKARVKSKGTAGKKIGQRAAEITISTRVVSYGASCTGTKASECRTLDKQLCETREQGYTVLSDATTLRTSLMLFITMMLMTFFST